MAYGRPTTKVTRPSVCTGNAVLADVSPRREKRDGVQPEHLARALRTIITSHYKSYYATKRRWWRLRDGRVPGGNETQRREDRHRDAELRIDPAAPAKADSAFLCIPLCRSSSSRRRRAKTPHHSALPGCRRHDSANRADPPPLAIRPTDHPTPVIPQLPNFHSCAVVLFSRVFKTTARTKKLYFSLTAFVRRVSGNLLLR
ncbi:hypothetical protein AAFF_G00276370 [Aldrovandia affinis]|uniref:Uncharacterized protein n=1 Tax=Aldrovandia affinis TaxID=143900 RepID=A0AAD7RAE4_9TELE|nr:hypothetical protein AAFF_G00276370 [Aldrovandia affinis]